MPERPYLLFYVSDWRGDVSLRSCSYAARGLWVEMMGIMHFAEPYGHLVSGGERLSEANLREIALQTAGTAREVKKLLAELKSKHIYSVDSDGTIYSRRMVRDESRRLKNQENGSKGGNPRLTKSDKRMGYPNRLTDTDKPSDKAHAGAIALDHIPETTTRDQLASLADSAREANTTSRAVKSPAFAFCEWMLEAGLSAGVIPAHNALDKYAWCYPQVGDAETLLGAYDESEVRTRAGRLIKACAARHIRLPISCKSLLKAWDWDEVAGKYALSGGARPRAAVQDDDEFLRGIRALENPQ